MPEYSAPIQLHEFSMAIKDISDEQLRLLNGKINTSINKLLESNKIMLALANGNTKGANEFILSKNEDKILDTDDFLAEPTDEDAQLYIHTVEENKKVILNQKSRLLALNQELQRRGLISVDEPYLNTKQKLESLPNLKDSKQSEEKSSVFL